MNILIWTVVRIPSWIIKTLDHLSVNQFRILDLLNSELKKRPTYHEAVNHFRVSIRPEDLKIHLIQSQIPDKSLMRYTHLFYFYRDDRSKDEVDNFVKMLKDEFVVNSEEQGNFAIYTNWDNKSNLAENGTQNLSNSLFVDATYVDYM